MKIPSMPVAKFGQDYTGLLLQAHYNWKNPGSGPYYDLLDDHNTTFLAKWDDLYKKFRYGTAKTVTIKLTFLEARAFMQLWIDTPMSLSESLPVNDIIKAIDAMKLTRKRMQREH